MVAPPVNIAIKCDKMVNLLKNQKEKSKIFHYDFFSKNRRGWIRIVEAFVAILLIVGVLLIVINKGYIGKADISEKVYIAQLSILREIEVDDSLRAEILNAHPIPVVLDQFNAKVPYVKNKIDTRTPDYLTCEGKICALDEICALTSNIQKDIYAQAVAITATKEVYSPRQLKLFCWVK